MAAAKDKRPRNSCRKRAGLSIERLVELSGVPRATVNRWLAGGSISVDDQKQIYARLATAIRERFPTEYETRSSDDVCGEIRAACEDARPSPESAPAGVDARQGNVVPSKDVGADPGLFRAALTPHVGGATGQASRRSRDTERARELATRATIGIITALPKELAAMKAMLEDPVAYGIEGRGAGREYLLGEVPAKGGGTHAVAIVCSGIGNNQAAARATLVLEHFPGIDAILMVGIAGAVPCAANAEEHVRLGDIVVSDHRGVIQYDFVKETRTAGGLAVEQRHSPRPPSARLLEADRELQSLELEGEYPWEQLLERARNLSSSVRPSTIDELRATADSSVTVPHPHDPNRRQGLPRVFRGAIASANALLKDSSKRDGLRDRFGVKAVEMEASGVADATWLHEVGYLVIRGTCDYCDRQKEGAWQMYAAVIAAAYARALMERIRTRAGAMVAAEPVPSYPDAATLSICARLQQVRARRQALRQVAADTGELDREIIELRRQLREGGQLRAGDTLGEERYLLVKQVGRGGFGTVWEAHDRERHERVAIKVLHGNLVGELQRRERFFRGARAMGALRHKAVVRVLDPGSEDAGYHYYVMEFVPGGDLRQAVLAKRLLNEQILPTILSIGDALAEAHAKGLVHRDIKPANILVGDYGAARLTDFDLVGAGETTGGTRTGAMGTFIYAAPELLDRPQDATARADVYGLAMTAIFALHGADLPTSTFGKGQADIIIASLPCEPAVKAVLKRAAAWDSVDRFANAAMFCRALRAAIPRHTLSVPAFSAHVTSAPLRDATTIREDRDGPDARRTPSAVVTENAQAAEVDNNQLVLPSRWMARGTTASSSGTAPPKPRKYLPVFGLLALGIATSVPIVMSVFHASAPDISTSPAVTPASLKPTVETDSSPLMTDATAGAAQNIGMDAAAPSAGTKPPTSAPSNKPRVFPQLMPPVRNQDVGVASLPLPATRGCTSECSAKHESCTAGCGPEPDTLSAPEAFQQCWRRCSTDHSRCRLACK